MGRVDKPLVNKMKEDFIYFGILSLLYGIIFLFCLYNNISGITFPLYVIATIVFMQSFMKKIGFKLQKNSKPYMIGMVLLGISSSITTSSFFHIFNWIGIILLLALLMMHQFYNDNDWNIVEYIERLFILFLTSIGSIAYPFNHLSNYLKNNSSKQKKAIVSVIIGLSISLILLGIILPILMNSDAVFERVFRRIFEYINLRTLFGFVFVFIIGFIWIYSFFIALCKYNFPKKRSARINDFNSIIGITFTSILAVIYVIYCIIQIVYLFMGMERGLPEGLTYSGYARSGFWELIFVSILNFLIVLACMYLFKGNGILRAVLTIISGCTFIIALSAAYRMLLYIAEYHLTFARVFVLWFLCILMFVMIGVIMNIYSESFSLFKYIIIVVSVFYIGFSLSRPDYWIARYNISNTQNMTVQDVHFLMDELSLDAAPAIAGINIDEIEEGSHVSWDENALNRSMRYYFENILEENQGIFFRRANYSRIRARLAADRWINDFE